MKIINLTPHALLIGVVPIAPSGDVARVGVNRRLVETLKTCDGDVACYVPEMGLPVGVPPYTDDVTYVVSAMVRSHPSLANRSDIASPGLLLRDAAGNVIGCDGLDFNS